MSANMQIHVGPDVVDVAATHDPLAGAVPAADHRKTGPHRRT